MLEASQVNQIKIQLEMERLEQMKKKQEERSMMTYLLDENTKAKAKWEMEKVKGKEEDVAIQQAYIQLLDKQEKDWIEEYKWWEAR